VAAAQVAAIPAAGIPVAVTPVAAQGAVTQAVAIQGRAAVLAAETRVVATPEAVILGRATPAMDRETAARTGTPIVAASVVRWAGYAVRLAASSAVAEMR
jgi:hypothetical protein